MARWPERCEMLAPAALTGRDLARWRSIVLELHQHELLGEVPAGLQRALAEKPDLILLDIMMPKLDGYAVCSELRRMDLAVPILMLTAKGQI